MYVNANERCEDNVSKSTIIGNENTPNAGLVSLRVRQMNKPGGIFVLQCLSHVCSGGGRAQLLGGGGGGGGDTLFKLQTMKFIHVYRTEQNLALTNSCYLPQHHQLVHHNPASFALSTLRSNLSAFSSCLQFV